MIFVADVRIAQSPAEMIDLVNQYLGDPASDAAGRRRIVAEQCEFTDGRAAERVAAEIVPPSLLPKAPIANTGRD